MLLPQNLSIGSTTPLQRSHNGTNVDARGARRENIAKVSNDVDYQTHAFRTVHFLQTRLGPSAATSEIYNDWL